MRKRKQRIGLSLGDALRSVPSDVTNLETTNAKRNEISRLFEVDANSHWHFDRAREYVGCSEETFLRLAVRQVPVFFADDVRELRTAYDRVVDECFNAFKSDLEKRLPNWMQGISHEERDAMLRNRLLKKLQEPSEQVQEILKLSGDIRRDKDYRKFVADEAKRSGCRFYTVGERLGHAYMTVRRCYEEYYGR